MSLFMEDPAHLSKSRLKSDLVSHNVALPPASSKKGVYVELHLKHIEQKKNAADFSSDEEEDRVQDVADKEEDAVMPDLSGLTDDDLKAALLQRGVKAGPIVASTRAVYEKKLRKLLQFGGRRRLNREEKEISYSDSEEEEEEEGENGDEQNEESGICAEMLLKEETVEPSHKAQQGSSQHAPATRNREPSPKRNSGNAIKSLERTRPHCSQIPVGISGASSVDQRSGLGSGMESSRAHSTSADTERDLNGSNVQEHWSRFNRDMPIVDRYSMNNQSLYYTPKASTYEWEMKHSQEPVKDTFKDMFLNTDATPTGIYATRRRPIKGAAGRPVQYAYPETPASPTTMERREVERHLVPVQIQILVFLIMACLLYLIYACVEDDTFSPFGALPDSLNQGSDSEEGLLLQAETQDAPAVFF